MYSMQYVLGTNTADLNLKNHRFGDVIDFSEIDNVECLGTEARIEDCSHSDIISCSGILYGGAGVECTGNSSAFDRIVPLWNFNIFILLIEEVITT